MFPREQRLRSSKQILTVFRRGERRVAGCVSCYFLPKPGMVEITVIIDSKVAKKAVDRNLVKRRVRAILQELKLPSGQLIIRLLAGAPALSFSELTSQVQRCLQKLPHSG